MAKRIAKNGGEVSGGKTQHDFSFLPSVDSLAPFADAPAEEKLKWLEDANNFVAAIRDRGHVCPQADSVRDLKRYRSKKTGGEP